MPKTTTRFPLKASVLAFALLSSPMLANAAGIGKLTVLSALGQPLRAEIELSATRDELSSLTVKLASQEQFRQQGMDFNASVAMLNMSVEKRANGQAYVRMTTDRPVNEPFLDVLIELAWASGRLTREYTFLLDPVELPRPASASVAAPGVSAVSPSDKPMVLEAPKASKSSKSSSAARTVPSEPAPKAAPAPKPEPMAKPAPRTETASMAGSDGSREVKRGDTLGKIASETVPDGVSLDQMLVALYNSNRDAFIGDNLNRLKTGKILSIPDREAVTAVSETEARKTVSVHARDFNAYRQQLAGAAADGSAMDAPAAQASSGKITPKVEDKAPAPAAGKDKLEVSKSEGAAKGSDKAGKSAAAAEEELIAKQKALKEAEARVAALEKNVADLQKLNEIKSLSLAEAEKKAAAAKAAPAPEPAKVAEAPKPVEMPKPVEAPKVETPKAEEKPADAAAPAAVEAPPAEKPVEAAPPPPPPKKKVVLPPEPEPEPTFMEEFGNFVFLGGALVALLGGFFGFREWKRRKDMDVNTSSQFDEVSSTSSVFGASGGQSVDTNNVSLASGFSQTSLTGNEGTAGVDPVAEAEVYMAYGRDAQAEEILLEAIKAEPTRQAVHLKLLELYAARKSIKPFEEVAKDLKQQTGGVGGNWERAAALGQGIDPGNPLYSSEGVQGASDTLAMDAFGTSTVIMPPGQLAKMAAMDPAKADTVVLPPSEPLAEEPAITEEEHSFDLDLGSDAPAEPTPETETPVTLDFDLDLGADDQAPVSTAQSTDLDFEVPSISPAEAPDAPAMDIEFDLGIPETPEANSAAEPVPTGNSVDFDFNLDTPEVSAPAPGALAPTVDFSDINLDLDTPVAPAVEAEVEPVPALAMNTPAEPADLPAELEADNAEVATKLELAQAYEEMGDKEGMRELLQEVLTEGSPAQQELARSKLEQHGL